MNDLYIHQLETENKQLRERIKNQEIVNKSLNEYIEKLKDYGEKVAEKRNQLYDKIDKAIECINEYFEITEYGEYYFTHKFDESDMKKLYEILGGIK